MHGAVIGAGIAGISVTHALRRIGIAVDLFEQAPEARSTGYQLNVWPNGKYALGQIGLLNALRDSGYGAAINGIVFVDGRTGRTIRRLATPSWGDYGGTSFYRGDLHKTLLQGLAGDPPQCSRAVEMVIDDPKSAKVRLHFSSGDAREFDFVIGADGINSKIRQHLFPEDRGFVPSFDALLFGARVDLNGRSAAERSFAEQLRQERIRSDQRTRRGGCSLRCRRRPIRRNYAHGRSQARAWHLEPGGRSPGVLCGIFAILAFITRLKWHLGIPATLSSGISATLIRFRDSTPVVLHWSGTQRTP